ncbi:MAG: UpxY family transcription antiterminator [Bacteroidia bacterium]|nr:UpxY family transcription antiterminator [Bacteroidia bacterium]
MLKIERSYCWYALYTRPRFEKRVDTDLREDGFEVYLPVMRTRRKWSDRIKWVDLPMFSGYIFVRVSHREYFKILQHPAAMKYISFGGQPSVVPEKTIHAIKRALGEGIDFVVTSTVFKPGQEIEVTAGPMIGYSGEVIRYDGKKSLLVRIGNTGLSMIVQMQAAYLQAMAKALVAPA